MSNRNFRDHIVKTSSKGDVTGRIEVRCGPRQINIKRPHQSVSFGIGTLNVGNMKGQASEITETVARKPLTEINGERQLYRRHIHRKYPTLVKGEAEMENVW